MAISTITEVKKVAQFTSEWSDEEIETEIDISEVDIYDRYSLPKRSQFSIDSDYSTFYVSPEKVHEVIRVQVAVETDVDPSGYINVVTGSDTWLHTTPNKYISLGSDFISTYDNKIVRIQYTPNYANGMATYMTALSLVDPTTIVDGEENIPPLVARLKNHLDAYKKQAKPKSILKSSLYTDYDRYDYISYSQSSLR